MCCWLTLEAGPPARDPCTLGLPLPLGDVRAGGVEGAGAGGLATGGVGSATLDGTSCAALEGVASFIRLW